MDPAILSFDEFLATQSYHLPVGDFLINLIIAGLLAFLLSYTYVHYGTALSNRKMFARNFVLMAMTTMFIITVVKSSLALSLGLVGALSIVRFRTAIKEPEELAYLFLTIAIGLGLGADQRVITTIAILVIIGLIIIRKKYIHTPKYDQNLHLTIASYSPDKIALGQIVSVLDKHCSTVNLKRFDESGEVLEATFFVKFNSFNDVENTKNELNSLSKSVKITFLDSQGTY
ncbi:DUF4956 domain-containing protein [Methanogenium marinum]|uniref:DUF4956 domain-containing protein n=1 Tax=Methanogenium marinum TaxID=348610 RepID=A0A9Q4KS50_9EURY|nr:DUF4956 domain-containing protein [Methanogenium marinum]MDE4907727.1 DUF4956 domain-containing protein [Methanogenium marinum]